MSNVIEFEVRAVYGRNTIYPVNDAAKLLAEIAGTKTLTSKVLVLAKRLGFCIVEVTPACTKCGMKEAV